MLRCVNNRPKCFRTHYLQYFVAPGTKIGHPGLSKLGPKLRPKILLYVKKSSSDGSGGVQEAILTGAKNRA